MLRTKIVGTLGPASTSAEVIDELVDAGLSMARINMSHGSHETHRAAIELVRGTARRKGHPLPILVDLSGPKIRVGTLDHPIELVNDSEVVVAHVDEARPGDIPTTYRHLAEDVQPGDPLLLDDGLLQLEALESDGVRARFRVLKGGTLKSRKGINLPGAEVKAPSLTDKDLRDLEFALDMGAEYISLSFVRKAQDVRDLKNRGRGRALVVAKIEKAQALEKIEEILEETDGVMVARGDLGVELPFEQVPLAQKRIIELANHYGRPVITATQMLESMTDNPRPTRAEASDVANAILDGTGAVMLSGETAVGAYPVEAVEAMSRIAREIEAAGVLDRASRWEGWGESEHRGGASMREHAVASATIGAVRSLSSPAIIVITRSGFSARLVSSYRPPVPVFAVCTDPMTYSQLSAVWGVRPLLAQEEEVSYESLTQFGKQAVVDTGVGRPGDTVVVTAGFPFHQSGSTNTFRVEQL